MSVFLFTERDVRCTGQVLDGMSTLEDYERGDREVDILLRYRGDADDGDPRYFGITFQWAGEGLARNKGVAGRHHAYASDSHRHDIGDAIASVPRLVSDFETRVVPSLVTIHPLYHAVERLNGSAHVQGDGVWEGLIDEEAEVPDDAMGMATVDLQGHTAR